MRDRCDKCGGQIVEDRVGMRYCPNLNCPSRPPETETKAGKCPRCESVLVIDGAGTPFCPSFVCRETEPWPPTEETCRQAPRDNTDMSKGGVKLDTNKLRYDLLPYDALSGIVEVLNYGAATYCDRNWENGMHYSRMWAAAIRHLVQFWSGEERDSESGLPHLHHAGCMILFLSSHVIRGIGTDDRPEGERSQPHMVCDATPTAQETLPWP